MGVNVILEDEGGDPISEVADPQGRISLLARRAHEDLAYRLFRYVDPWRDTVFNTLQVPDLIEDMELARRRNISDADRQVLADVIALARLVLEEPHRYLRFRGD